MWPYCLRGCSSTKIPCSGLIMRSPMGNSSSLVCLDFTRKFRKMLDSITFSSKMANFWPDQKNKHSKLIHAVYMCFDIDITVVRLTEINCRERYWERERERERERETPTNAISWASREGNITVRMSLQTFFWQKSVRVKFLRVRKEALVPV